MELILIGVGGALGSISRFTLGKAIAERTSTTFPLGTVIINFLGAFLLGIISQSNINHSIFIMLTEGYLGGFTTFSTFMYEGFNLFQENEKLNAFMYIGITLVLGIVGYVLGVVLSR